MSETRTETDWPRLLPEVARRLLGDPPRTQRSGDTWRYGTHGSLAVHVGGDRAGTWRDFEAGEGGGTLDLVQHVQQCDKAAALRWLEDEGLIERRTAHGDGRDRAQATASTPQATPRQPQSDKTAPVAAAILRAAVTADDTPARRYLARRWTWPLVGIGPDLPTTVRYVDAGDIPEQRRQDGTPYRVLPAAAAGGVVFVLTDPAGRLPPAVSLEAVTAKGRRLDWCGHERWRRTYGSKTGLVFEAANTPGGYVVLAEGECDALALALTLRAGCVRSVGGTSGFRREAAADPAKRPVALVPDTGKSGEAAITSLLTDLPKRLVKVVPWPRPRVADGDPAAWLADWLYERAGIRELDGGMDRAAATVAAWYDLLAAIERGDTILIDLEDHEDD